jgi:hypothetical protein
MDTDLIRNRFSISSALKGSPESCRAYSQSCASDTEGVHDVQLVDVESLELESLLPVRFNCSAAILKLA